MSSPDVPEPTCAGDALLRDMLENVRPREPDGPPSCAAGVDNACETSSLEKDMMAHTTTAGPAARAVAVSPTICYRYSVPAPDVMNAYVFILQAACVADRSNRYHAALMARFPFLSKVYVPGKALAYGRGTLCTSPGGGTGDTGACFVVLMHTMYRYGAGRNSRLDNDHTRQAKFAQATLNVGHVLGALAAKYATGLHTVVVDDPYVLRLFSKDARDGERARAAAGGTENTVNAENTEGDAGGAAAPPRGDAVARGDSLVKKLADVVPAQLRPIYCIPRA